MRESVYVVIRRNNDMKDYMVEIKGIFKSRDEALNHRQYLADMSFGDIQTEVESYALLDTINWNDDPEPELDEEP